jgi:hypothetical protein
LAHFGYQNNSADTLNLPIGPKNLVTPGPDDAGQPTEFFKGRATNTFTKAFPSGETLRWVLGNTYAEASIRTERCSPGTIDCVDTDNKALLASLDNTSAEQRKIVRRLANRILAVHPDARNRMKAEGFLVAADKLYNEQWTSIWGSFSVISRNCTSCAAVDKNADIQTLSIRSQGFVILSNQVAKVLKAANGGKLSRTSQSLVNSVASVHQKFLTSSKSLPRFESKCN